MFTVLPTDKLKGPLKRILLALCPTICALFVLGWFPGGVTLRPLTSSGDSVHLVYGAQPSDIARRYEVSLSNLADRLLPDFLSPYAVELQNVSVIRIPLILIIKSKNILILRPSTRSLIGFENLIEREWIRLGYPFAPDPADWFDASVPPDYDGGASFALFVDCVHQLLFLFPVDFAFTENCIDMPDFSSKF
ncbi:hypothetical protein AHF37_00792 [Paragonimus kellicotti]|nr:hypothetical protein AHF37_00792 [Paragonimus kellicotti]